MKKRWLVITCIGAVVALCIYMAAQNKPVVEETIGGDKDGMRVQVEYIKKQDIQAKISSSGKLEAINDKTLYMDQANKVLRIEKEVGDKVEKGELLLVFDKEAKVTTQRQIEVLKAKLDAANKNLSDLKSASSEGDILAVKASISTLEDTKKQAENSILQLKDTIKQYEDKLEDINKKLAENEDLLKEGLVSQQEIDNLNQEKKNLEVQKTQAENNISLSEEQIKTTDINIESNKYKLDVLLNKVEDKNKTQQIIAKQTEIKELQNQIRNAETDLNNVSTHIYAPISGIITYLPEGEGMTIQGGSPILTIVDPSTLKVTCKVSPYYAPDLKLGLDVELKYMGSKVIPVDGKITKIAALAEVEKGANGETTSLPVEITIDKPGEILRPGFTVNAKIITDKREDVCVVPILAIEEDDDESYVYIVKEDGSLEKRKVEQGLSDALNVEVTNVKEGEMIVSSVEDFVNETIKVSYEKIQKEPSEATKGAGENK